MAPGYKRKQLTADDEVRQLHEAYQFMLKKYGLGETPKNSVSENPMISPFMKLTLDDDVPKKHVDFKDEETKDEDAEMNDNEENEDEDDVFEKMTIQVEEAAAISAVETELPDEVESDDENFARSLKLAPKPNTRARSRSFKGSLGSQKEGSTKRRSRGKK